MKRDVRLEEISDGRLYGLNDMVKADCKECEGCSSCCRGMGNSIVLNPFDIHRMVSNLHCTFEELMVDKIELNVVDGIILPNIRMSGNTEKCSFLNGEGRCSIHRHRPEICRIFPLGRYYEHPGFQYFLQIHECKKENRTKIKVKKWIDSADLKRNEPFIAEWHYFLNDVEEKLALIQGDNLAREINLFILRRFYMDSFSCQEDFYIQFQSRLMETREFISEILMRDSNEE